MPAAALPVPSVDFDKEMAIYHRVNHYLGKMKKNPAKVERYLKKLSELKLTGGILKGTGAQKVVFTYFDHPTCGDLARKLSCDWMFNTAPSIVPKRKVDTDSSIVPLKRAKISEEKENITLGKTVPPPLSPSASVPTSRPIPPKNVEEARLKAITERIAKRKAESEAKSKKAINLVETTMPSGNRKHCFIGANGRQMIQLNGKRN